MARIALPHPHRERANRPTNAALVVVALFVAAAGLAALLSTVQVPSSATQGLPSDWAQRGAWLAVQGLIGLGVAWLVITVVHSRSKT